MQKLVPQFSPSSAMADFEEATVSAFHRVLCYRDRLVLFRAIHYQTRSVAYINCLNRTRSHSRRVHHTVAGIKKITTKMCIAM